MFLISLKVFQSVSFDISLKEPHSLTLGHISWSHNLHKFFVFFFNRCIYVYITILFTILFIYIMKTLELAYFLHKIDWNSQVVYLETIWILCQSCQKLSWQIPNILLHIRLKQIIRGNFQQESQHHHVLFLNVHGIQEFYG